MILSNGWNETRIESISFIQHTFTECLPYARCCEESVILVFRSENEAGKNVVTCSRKNQPVSGYSSNRLILPSEPLHILFPQFDPFFLQVFMWLAASIMHGSAQLSPPRGVPPRSHCSKSPFSLLCQMTLLYSFLIIFLFENDLIESSLVYLSICSFIFRK